MTDYEQVVKALRYCSTTEGMVYCNVNCKYGWEERSKGCKDLLMTDAAAAIEALQAERDEWIDRCYRSDEKVAELSEKVAERQALLKEADKKQAYQHDYICELVAEVEELKAAGGAGR